MADTEGLLIQVLNVVLYIFFAGSSVYSLFGPVHYHVIKETYFTPAEWVVGLWSIIHILLLGTVIYQFFEPGKKIIVNGLHWRFPLLVILSSVYVNVLGRGWLIVAFILALLVSSLASHIWLIIKKNHAADSANDEVFVHLPFSLWHGFSIFLVFVSAFEAFGVNANRHHDGIFTKIFVFLALLSLESTGAAYAFSSPEGDLAGSIAIAWSLFAVFDHQRSSPFIHWSALGFSILSVFWIAKALYALFSRRRHSSIFDSERAPLIGSS